MESQVGAPTAARAPASVLVVDDDDDLRAAVMHVLRDAGYRVQLARNGREALDLLDRSHTPDLIVLDLVMPQMDGWEFRLEQRRRPKLAQVPVLVLSADRSSKARAIDADGFLHKPLDARSFLHAVELGLRAAERRRQAQSATEHERFGALDTLAAGIAHEINNPLAVVTGNVAHGAELLASLHHEASASPLLGRVLGLLERAQQGADRIAQVVHAVAAFAHPPDARTSAVDLCAVLDASIRLVDDEARHRAHIHTAIEGPLFVLGNAGQLRQVFVNLLTNAVHAVDEGGNPFRNAIHVTAARQRTGRIVVEVSDTGTGIHPEHLASVFDPFFTSWEAGHGMGLGLAVSQRMVAAAGGVIGVRSTRGEGACFRVELPSCLPPGAAHVQPAAVVVAAPRPRVLVIDDELLVCEMLAGMLEEACDVTWFNDSRAALDAMRRDPHWDVVLSDVTMPGLSGVDLYAEVARSLEALAPRFVFMTGGTFTARAQAFLASLPSAPLRKPFGRDAVLARIRRIVAALGAAQPDAADSTRPS